MTKNPRPVREDGHLEPRIFHKVYPRTEQIAQNNTFGHPDRAIVPFLVFLVLITRVPFRSHVLYNWDSANFALALLHFDVTRHFPHPPGYFSYVQLGGLINDIIHEANASFVAESMLFSALGVVALYYLGYVMFDRATGFIAALLLVFSVTFWSYGTIALPYVTLAFFSTTVAALAYSVIFARRSFRAGLLPLSLIYTIAGGFRPDLLLFLSPLWLVGLWFHARRCANWSERLRSSGIAVLIVGAGFVAWFVPTVWLSGGLGSYLATFAAYTSVDVLDRYSVPQNGLAALIVNIRDTASYLFFGMYATAGLLVLGVMFKLRSLICHSERNEESVTPVPGSHAPITGSSSPLPFPTPTVPRNDSKRAQRLTQHTVFLIGWLAPMALFYTWIHVGDPGYVFTMLPAFLIVAARSAVAAADWGAQYISPIETRRVASLRNGTLAVIVGAVLVMNIGIDFVHVRPLTLSGMAQADRSTAGRIAYIREHYSPSSTLLISYDLYRHLIYYLPEYESVWIDVFGRGDSEKILAPGTERIVLVDERLAHLAPGAEAIDLPEGKMYSLPVGTGKRVVYSSEKIEVR